MKVCVIKRNNNTYYKRYFENYVQFEDEIPFAEIYTTKSGAENTINFITRNKYRFNILPEELSVVEYNLIETTELADYTKQARKEVLSELMNMLGDRAELIDFGNGCAEFMFTTYDLQECSKELLDQIQGE